MLIDHATPAMVPALVALVNGAYRGAGAARGWTHEAELLDGQRTDLAMLQAAIDRRPGVVLVAREAPDGPLLGCVAAEPTATPATWTFGMLTVDPAWQAGGRGRRLIEEAERYARAQGAARMVLTVIEGRDALIAWYERRGYRRTGETVPFPSGDERFGRPRRPDLAFVVLAKGLP